MECLGLTSVSTLTLCSFTFLHHHYRCQLPASCRVCFQHRPLYFSPQTLFPQSLFYSSLVSTFFHNPFTMFITLSLGLLPRPFLLYTIFLSWGILFSFHPLLPHLPHLVYIFLLHLLQVTFQMIVWVFVFYFVFSSFLLYLNCRGLQKVCISHGRILHLAFNFRNSCFRCNY